MAGGNWYRAGPGPKNRLMSDFFSLLKSFDGEIHGSSSPLVPDLYLNTSFHSLNGPSWDGIFLRHFSLSSYLRIFMDFWPRPFLGYVKVAVCCKWAIWNDNEKNLESDTQNSNNKIIFSTIIRVFTLNLDAIYDSLLRNDAHQTYFRSVQIERTGKIIKSTTRTPRTSRVQTTLVEWKPLEVPSSKPIVKKPSDIVNHFQRKTGDRI